MKENPEHGGGGHPVTIGLDQQPMCRHTVDSKSTLGHKVMANRL